MNKTLIKNDQDKADWMAVNRHFERKWFLPEKYPYVLCSTEIDGFNGSHLEYEAVELSDFE